ncbi:hypothetical protein Emag_003863 [Eimeria magna]
MAEDLSLRCGGSVATMRSPASQPSAGPPQDFQFSGSSHSLPAGGSLPTRLPWPPLYHQFKTSRSSNPAGCLAQLLHPRAAHPGGGTAEPAWGASCSEILRLGVEHAGSAEAVLSSGVRPPQEAAGGRGEGSIAASTKQWLTGQFVAQVGAHLEAALHDSDLSKSEARGSSPECDSAEAFDAAVRDSRRYAQAISRAALQWGLLLLLAVEHLLYKRTRRDPPPHPKSTPAIYGCEVEGAVDSQKPVTSTHAVDSSSGIAAPADSVIRGEGQVDEKPAAAEILTFSFCVRMRHLAAEVLAAFEVIFRASPAVATRVLPNIVAWLDAGLLALVEERKAVTPSGANVVQLGEDHTHGQQAYHGARWDLECLVSQLPPGGCLSAVVTSSLGYCHASGPIRRPVEHLQRTRLLGLLLRGPRVLMCSARLLAACAVPPSRIDGSVATSAPSWMPGTVPQHTEEHGASEASFKVEAEVQQRLCNQTAKVICYAIQNLRDALIPNVHKTASDCVALLAPQSDLRFPEKIEKTFLRAFVPSCLRWLPGSKLGPSDDATEPYLPLIEGTPSEELNEWVFVFKTVDVTNETLRKVALQILESTKVRHDFRVSRKSSSADLSDRHGEDATRKLAILLYMLRFRHCYSPSLYASKARRSATGPSASLPLLLKIQWWNKRGVKDGVRRTSRLRCRNPTQRLSRMDCCALLRMVLAAALLNQIDKFFVFVANSSSSASRLELPLAARVHCVTRLSSLALTAKHLPKAYQVNPVQADSRILLTAGAAAAVAQLQIAEGGEDRMPRCPLTEEHEGATVGIFAYLNDEGAFRMAAQVARILIALVRDITVSTARTAHIQLAGKAAKSTMSFHAFLYSVLALHAVRRR